MAKKSRIGDSEKGLQTWNPSPSLWNNLLAGTPPLKRGAPLCVRQSTFGTHGPDTCFPTQSRLAAAAHSYLLPSTVSHGKQQVRKQDSVSQNIVDQGRPDHPRHRPKDGSASGSDPEPVRGYDIKWMVHYKAKKAQASVIKLLIDGGNSPENNTK